MTETARPGPTSAADSLIEQAEDKLKKLAELRRHRRGIEAAVSRLRRELAELFDAGSTEVLELTLGRLRRVRQKVDDEWDFVLEV